MRIEEFKQDFCFELIEKEDKVITCVISKDKEQKLICVKTTINIFEVENFVEDSKSLISITPWNKEMVYDSIKRNHLNYLAICFGIEDWYPLNQHEHPDISKYYC